MPVNIFHSDGTTEKVFPVGACAKAAEGDWIFKDADDTNVYAVNKCEGEAAFEGFQDENGDKVFFVRQECECGPPDPPDCQECVATGRWWVRPWIKVFNWRKVFPTPVLYDNADEGYRWDWADISNNVPSSEPCCQPLPGQPPAPPCPGAECVDPEDESLEPWAGPRVDGVRPIKYNDPEKFTYFWRCGPNSLNYSHWTDPYVERGLTDSGWVNNPFVVYIFGYDRGGIVYSNGECCITYCGQYAAPADPVELRCGEDFSVCVTGDLISLEGRIDWLYPAGGTLSFAGEGVDENGYFTPSVAGVGVHPILITYTVGGLPQVCEFNITVASNVDVTGCWYDYETLTPNVFRVSEDPWTGLTCATPTGGSYTGTGVSWVTDHYEFDPTTAGIGTHTLTYTATIDGVECSDTFNVEVVADD
jgi:hypothetical protein